MVFRYLKRIKINNPTANYKNIFRKVQSQHKYMHAICSASVQFIFNSPLKMFAYCDWIQTLITRLV